MLIQFSVGNFLSFKDNVTFSMVASSIKEHIDTNVIQTKYLKLLKSSVIYGANASGKSNLFKALSFMSKFIKNSSKEGQFGEEIEGVEGFRLSTENTDQPSYFEIVFLHEGIQYRYGFEVNYLEVVREWLYSSPKKTEVELFTREKDKFNINKGFKEGFELDKRTRNNALFISVVANFKGEISTKVIDWFRNLNVISGLDENFTLTRRKLKDESFKDELLNLLKTVDLGIEDIESDDDNDIPKPIEDFLRNFTSNHVNPKIRINSIKIENMNLTTFRKKFDHEKKFIGFEKFLLSEHESEGTKKLFVLFGPILESLKEGTTLVVDELDAKLHPLLTRSIIKMFHSDVNNKGAQLIFNSHDTNLLSKYFFRRDQIWFTEKDEYGSTELYSLVDYNVRNDASFEKDYLLGKYGSVPYIGSFHFFDESDGAENGE